jgi:UDP-2-acetamido-3-amino-2,3-dideoxy-glucuronate N-acetyltransferase
VKPRLVRLETHNHEGRGRLTTIEPGEDSIVPFNIKRVFYVYDVPLNTTRGGHGHKTCEQFLIAIGGMVLIKLQDSEFLLDSPEYGLYVPVNNLIRTIFLTPDSCLLCFASELYDKDDYIYDTVS